MSNTHAGKVAIVTGSARGIGAAIASQLANEAAKVVVNYNTGKAAANDVVAAILRDGGGGSSGGTSGYVRTASRCGASSLQSPRLNLVRSIIWSTMRALILYKPLADVTRGENSTPCLLSTSKAPFSPASSLQNVRLQEGGSIVNLSSSSTTASNAADICNIRGHPRGSR